MINCKEIIILKIIIIIIIIIIVIKITLINFKPPKTILKASD